MIGERTKTSNTRLKSWQKSPTETQQKEKGREGFFPAWLLSPPRPFGHTLLLQHSLECLFMTRKLLVDFPGRWGSSGGMEQGKRAGTTLHQILNCLETVCSLPNPCAVLPVTWRLRRAHKGATGAMCLCFANPSWPCLSCSTQASTCGRGVCFAKQGAGSSQWT